LALISFFDWFSGWQLANFEEQFFLASQEYSLPEEREIYVTSGTVPLALDQPGTIWVSGTQVPGSGSKVFFPKCYR